MSSDEDFAWPSDVMAHEFPVVLNRLEWRALLLLAGMQMYPKDQQSGSAALWCSTLLTRPSEEINEAVCLEDAAEKIKTAIMHEARDAVRRISKQR